MLGSEVAAPATAAALPAPVEGRNLVGEHETSELMRRGLELMNSCVSLIDVRQPAQPLVYVNPAFVGLTGFPAAEGIGRSWTLGEGPETDPAAAASLHEAVARGVEIRVRLRCHRRDGTAYWSETLMVPIPDETGLVTHFMSVQKDVTEIVEVAQRAAHMAYHDQLTGLPNRAQFQEHLALAQARADRRESAFALVFFDLDLFKQVNDRHGHEAGDRLLEDIARRWRSVARDGDVLARYGGDEFVLLITDLSRDCARDVARAAAARYILALDHPFNTPDAPNEVIEIGVSAGVALYPEDGATPAALLLAADAEMYAGKRARNPNPARERA